MDGAHWFNNGSYNWEPSNSWSDQPRDDDFLNNVAAQIQGLTDQVEELIRRRSFNQGWNCGVQRGHYMHNYGQVGNVHTQHGSNYMSYQSQPSTYTYTSDWNNPNHFTWEDQQNNGQPNWYFQQPPIQNEEEQRLDDFLTKHIAIFEAILEQRQAEEREAAEQPSWENQISNEDHPFWQHPLNQEQPQWSIQQPPLQYEDQESLNDPLSKAIAIMDMRIQEMEAREQERNVMSPNLEVLQQEQQASFHFLENQFNKAAMHQGEMMDDEGAAMEDIEQHEAAKAELDENIVASKQSDVGEEFGAANKQDEIVQTADAPSQDMEEPMELEEAALEEKANLEEQRHFDEHFEDNFEDNQTIEEHEEQVKAEMEFQDPFGGEEDEGTKIQLLAFLEDNGAKTFKGGVEDLGARKEPKWILSTKQSVYKLRRGTIFPFDRG